MMQVQQLTLGQVSTMFYPAYEYETLEYRKANHLLTSQFHYYNCDCAECYKAHFPCDDPTCAYCESVKNLMFENTRDDDTYPRMSNIIAVSTGKKIDYSPGNIIDYGTWLTWADDYEYSNDEMTWRKCNQCGELITGHDGNRYDFYGYFCDSECLEAYKIGNTIYCAKCGEEEVESEDDICENCQEDTTTCKFCNNPISEDHKYLCDNCLENSDHGYPISTDEMEYYDECWIEMDGQVYFVSDDSGGHESAAYIMGYDGESDCENHGFVHLSGGYGHSWEYIPNNFTDQQAEAIMEICEIKGWELPEEIEKYRNNGLVIESEEFIIKPMQNLNPSWLSMKRSMRDMFYRLSGD